MDSLFLKNYWIKEELGRGEISTVFKAVNSETKEEVALKKFILPPMLLQSQRLRKFQEYEKEIEKVIPFDHPNILKFKKFFQEGSDFYLETELLKGINLATIIEKNLSIKMSEGVGIYLKCAKALMYAHQQGVLHKYIKPSNIIVTADDQVKLTDFGCYLFNKDDKEEDITTDKFTPKNIDYFSPEQLVNEGIDARSDMFSLSAVMYHLFTGVRPFRGDTREELELAVLEHEPQSSRNLNPNIPELLDFILKKALSKDPDKRYRNMEEMVEGLEYLYTSGVVSDKIINARQVQKVGGKISSTFKNVRDGIRSFFRQVTGESEPEGKGVGGRGKTSARPGVVPKEITIKGRKFMTFTSADAPLPMPETGGVGGFLDNAMKFTTVIALIVIVAVVGSSYFNKDKKKDSLEQVSAGPSEQMSRMEGQQSSTTIITASETDPDIAEAENQVQGTLRITCNVPDAYVYVKNYYRRDIPIVQTRTEEAGTAVELETVPGTYFIRVVKEMYIPYETRVEVLSGQEKAVDIAMKQTSARLQVYTNPDMADVILDDVFFGKTPLTLYDLEEGTYKMVLNKPGYQSYQDTIEVSDSNPAVISHDFTGGKSGKTGKGDEEHPGGRSGQQQQGGQQQTSGQQSVGKGSITITSRPSRALVLINGTSIGYTPITRHQFSAGHHKIEVKYDGYKSWSQDIDIFQDLNRDIFVELQKESPLEGTITIGKASPSPSPTLGGDEDYDKASGTRKSSSSNTSTSSASAPPVKVMVRLVFNDGTAYEKMVNKKITISFDKDRIGDTIKETIKKYPGIELTDQGFQADMLINFTFSVRVDSDSSAKRPGLTLSSSIYVTDMQNKIAYYRTSNESQLEFPSGRDLKRSNEKTSQGFGTESYIDITTATEETLSLLENKLSELLSQVSGYDTSKSQKGQGGQSQPRGGRTQQPPQQGGGGRNQMQQPADGGMQDRPGGENKRKKKKQSDNSGGTPLSEMGTPISGMGSLPGSGIKGSE